MKITEKSKRLGIFVFYDRDFIIDDYVIYMLDSFNAAVDNIIFVSNVELSESELKKLDKYNIDINIRENKGLDAGAFKFVYDKYGADYLSSYDELILMNDTFFGPFKPFKDIINDMNNRDLDFWGLTANYESKDGTGRAKDGFIHSHIQTFFVAYRQSVLKSNFFNNYWKKYNINKNNSFVDVVNNHESYFTYLLEKEGFKWDTYVDLKHYKKDERKYNYNVYGYSAYGLIKYFGCPFIKRKNFVFDKNCALYMNDGLDTKRALEYIKDNELYDINMIYKNIKRLYKPYDLYQGLNLNYVVHDAENYNSNFKSVIIANVCDVNAYKLSEPYFSSINNSHVLLFTENLEISKLLNIKYEQSIVNYIINNKHSLINKYDNICLLHLDDNYNGFQEVIDSNIIRVLDNMVKSDKYINGVTNILNSSIVDILFAPESLHNKNIMNLNGRKKFLLKQSTDCKDIIDDDNSKIIKSFNGVWLKSSVLNDIDKTGFSFEQFIGLFDILTNNLYGKVYSEEYIENDVIVFENILSSLLYNKDLEMSYPNKMSFIDGSSFFRKVFRNIVPFALRKKLKRLVRKNGK